MTGRKITKQISDIWYCKSCTSKDFHAVFLSCHHLKRMGIRLMFWSILGLHMLLKWCCTALLGLEGAIEREGGPTTCMQSILGQCVFTCWRKKPTFVLLLCMFNFSSLVLHFDSMKIEVQLALHETLEQPTPWANPSSPCFALSGSFIFVVLSFFMQMFFVAFNVLFGCRLGSNQHWWGGSTV